MAAPPKEMTEAQRRVLEAAVEVFAERGYAGASTQEIARRAGVAEGTVFKQFKTKKDLLLGAVMPLILRFVAPQVMRQFETVLDVEHASFEDLLRTIVTDRIAWVKANPALLRIMIQEFPFHPELRRELKAVTFDRLYPVLQRAIERFQREGQVRTMPTRTIVRVMLSVFLGYAITRMILAPDADWDDAREIDDMIRVLSAGFAAPRKESPKHVTED